MDASMDARNALGEAREIAGPDAWVLEPSPPAVSEAPFFADDPATAGTLDWRAWVNRHPDRAAWAADRWLGAWRRLGPAPAPLADADAPLAPAAAAAGFLGDWYGFAWSVLEHFRAESAEEGRVQLWPEHFDAAVACFSDERLTTFGASPGDQNCTEPYLYVTAPSVVSLPSDLWNASFFDGAVLRLSELVGVDDQHRPALDFFRARHASLS